MDALDAGGRRRGRTRHRDLGHPAIAVDDAGHGAVADAVALDRSRERSEGEAPLALGTITSRGHLRGAALDRLLELRARHHLVHETPLDGAVPLDAFFQGAEEVGAVPANLPLVDEAGEAARTGQNGEEGDL